MEIVSAADFQRHVGTYQDRALVEPVMLTCNGRERLVLLAADEYRRLKQLDRQALLATEISNEDLAAIEAAEVPAQYAHLDDELTG
jgi:PHD/YefM family antitoxin component YafN of YafNO toxin-antitoxin module